MTAFAALQDLARADWDTIDKHWADIDDDISKAATNKQLWALAEAVTPTEDSGRFAQAMMD